MDDLVTGEMARLWREEEDLSQADLAGAIGVSSITYGGFERGGNHMKYPSMKALEALMDGRSAIPERGAARRRSASGPKAVAENPAPYSSTPLNAITLLAKDLRHLADILDSPDYPKDFKIDKFVEWITFTHKELKSVLRAMGKLPEKDPEQ